MGGASANVDGPTQDALYQMGINIGIAFQIKDDLLDLGFGANIGKPTGGDIQENKLTLPILHALQHGSKETIAFIKLLLKNKNVRQKELFVLQQKLMECGSIAYATEAMNRYAKTAQDILAQFPQSDVSGSIHKLIQFTIERDK
jgi:octaprenyl-diphosphate synthase